MVRENFLKKAAWKESEAGRTKVYLIKERKTGNIRAYFSIKCGMLYSPYAYQKLYGDDREFFEMIMDAMRSNDEELLKDYKASDYYTPEKFEELYNEAQRIVEDENNRKNGISKESFNVDSTYSAIEIENLCKNYTFVSDGDNDKISMGFLIFWIFIIPLIKEIAQKVGCEYIYIFAADQSENPCNEKNNVNKLITHYKTNFGFHEPDEVYFIRPCYDNKCYEMIQTVKEAIENSENIWEQFDDILNDTDNVGLIVP